MSKKISGFIVYTTIILLIISIVFTMINMYNLNKIFEKFFVESLDNSFNLMNAFIKSYESFFYKELERTLENIRLDKLKSDYYVSLLFFDVKKTYHNAYINEIDYDELPEEFKEKLSNEIDYYIYKNIFGGVLRNQIYIRVDERVYFCEIKLPIKDFRPIFENFIDEPKTYNFLISLNIYSSNLEPIFSGAAKIEEDYIEYAKEVLKTNKEIILKQNNFEKKMFIPYKIESSHEQFGPFVILANLNFSNVYLKALILLFAFTVVLIILIIQARSRSHKVAKELSLPIETVINNMEKFKKSFDFTDLELKTTNIFEIDELSTNYEIFAKELSKSYKQLRSLLEELEMKNIELKNLNKQLENSYIEFAKKLAEIAEIYDEETGNHIERVGVIAGFIAKKLRLSAETVLKIEQFAPLHDIGKLLVPKEILLKRGKLTSKEWEIIKMHTVYGAKIIGDNPNYRIAKNIALYHHEKYDGSGYPYGLKNDEIPIEAAITTIADVYDALRSFRPYKKAISHEEAIRILKEGDNRTRPESFHPEILKVFLDNEREIKEIWEKNFKVAKKDKI